MSALLAELPLVDLLALAFNVLAFTGYRIWQRRRGRERPGATLQSQQAATRADWVAEVFTNGNGILAVQALRNVMMSAVFFASNTVLLVIGALTLTLQGHLAHTWTFLTTDAGASVTLARTKLMLLLLMLLIAFFCFVNAIRLLAHGTISVSTRSANPKRATAQIDAAWRYQGLGVRCYYFVLPMLFWLFGPQWFVLGGIGAIVMMHRFDNPRPEFD